MSPENSFELPADPLDRRPRALVARVGVQADAEHLPRFEGVREHEQLGFGVGASANGIAAEPGVADLAGVGIGAAVAFVALGPGPTLDVPEARGTDDRPVRAADDCEGHGGAGLLPFESGCNLVCGPIEPLRDRAPLVKCRIGYRSSGKSIGVAEFERLQADEPAREDKTLSDHGFQYGGNTLRDPTVLNGQRASFVAAPDFLEIKDEAVDGTFPGNIVPRF